MADLRSAKIPENIGSYASGIGGFSETAIDQACMALEREPIGERESRWPELGRMIHYCQRHEITEKRKEPKFCDDCRETHGFLYFDAPRNGNRLRGMNVMRMPRFAQPCPNCRPGVSI